MAKVDLSELLENTEMRLWREWGDRVPESMRRINPAMEEKFKGGRIECGFPDTTVEGKQVVLMLFHVCSTPSEGGKIDRRNCVNCQLRLAKGPTIS